MTTAKILLQTLISVENLKNAIRADAPLSFSVKPDWQVTEKAVQISYSVKANVPGIIFGALGAGIYFPDGTKITTAANSLPFSCQLIQIENWILSGSWPPLDARAQITVGIVAIVQLGGQLQTFSYLQDFQRST